MKNTLDLRAHAHEMVDRMSDTRPKALLDLIDEDFFNEAEKTKIG